MTTHKHAIRLGYILLIAIAGYFLFNTLHTKEESRPLTRTEKIDYIQQLEISDLFADRVEMVGGHKLPGISFRLRNNSDATFSSVKVKLSFFDKRQRLVHETYFHPVHDNTNFSYAIDELAPNEIWQMSNSRFYTPSNIPNHWESGNATVEVVDVALADSN
jgi:hypothetical protein